MTVTDELMSNPHELADSPFADSAQRESSSTRELQDTGNSRNVVAWHIVVDEENLEPSELAFGTRIVGQFPPEEFVRNVGGVIVDAGAYGRIGPLIQWVAGEAETVSFSAKLWSSHRHDHTARDKLEILERLTKPAEPVKRPPIVRLFWGNAIPGGIQCMVQSIGGVKYIDVREDGSPRGIDLQITVKKYTPFIIDRQSSSAMEQTPRYVARDGDTYEMIALRRYGDPLIGVALRQMNPRYPMEEWAPSDYAELQAGETIKLYDRSDIDTNGITPRSHVLNLLDPVTAVTWRYYFKKRGLHVNVIPRR